MVVSIGNLAKALHDELCETLPCRYQIPDMDTGLPVRVTQFAHAYPREFWEGMAEAVVNDYAELARQKVMVELACEHDNVGWCGSCDALQERGVLA